MPEPRAYRAITVDRDRASDDEPSIWRAALAHILGRHPREIIGFAVAFAALTAIVVNALYLQPGPHPAPIFKLKPRPVAASEPPASAVPLPRPRPAEALAPKPEPAPGRPKAEIVAAIQRELAKRNFYDGPADGITGPRTDGAIRDYVQAAGLKSGSEPTEDLLRSIERSPLKAPGRAAPAPSRADPIGELIAPSPKRVLAVQRALADYGYGQVKPTGTLGPETQTAIEKFERERKLPITGQISDRLVRELAAVTGQPLE